MTTLDYIMDFPAVERLGWTLLHFVWQGALLGLLAALGLRIVREQSPRVAYLICILTMCLCAILPVVTFFSLELPDLPVEMTEQSVAEVALPAAPATVVDDLSRFPPEAIFVPEAPTPQGSVEAGVVEAPSVDDRVERLLVRVRSVLPWLVLAWFGIALGMSFRLLCAWLEVRGYVRRANADIQPEWSHRMGDLCQRMGIATKVCLLESVEMGVPAVVGAFRPVVLLPLGFLTGMAPALAEAVILHELAHIRRHDYLVNLLQALLRSLLFYHPAVWWLDRKATQLREFCCDEMAANAVADKGVYARALEALAARKGEGLKLAPAANDGSLVQRIRLLLGVGHLKVPSVSHMAGGSVFVLIALAGTFSLYFSPVLQAEGDSLPLSAMDGVEGQVLDANGDPVANADVALYHLKYYYGLDNGVVEKTRTDQDGRFELDTRMEFFRRGGNSTRDIYTVVAWDEDGTQDQALAWEVLASHLAKPQSLVLRLEKARPKTVRVFDQNGQAIQGADVHVHRLGRGDKASLFASGFGPTQAKTDKDGIAEFSGLPETPVNFAATMPGYANSWTGCGAVDAYAEIQLNPAAVVEGQVVDEAGAPIPGILVCATPEWSLMDYDYARTDERGRFRLDHLYGEGGCWTDDGGSGQYRISLDDTNYQAQAQVVHLQTGEILEGMRIEAKAAVPVSGVVRDPSTELPVPFAVLSVQTPGVNKEMEADGDGRFKFSSPSGNVRVGFWTPPPGTYVISGMVDRERPSWINREVGREPVELTLYAPSEVSAFVRVEGRVVRPDGSPAEGVVLAARLDRGRAQIVTEDRRNASLREVTTGADGRFILADYPKGEAINCLLRHKDKSLGALVELPAVSDGGGDVGDITLGKTIRKRLKIVDIEGRPLANAEIDYGPFSGPDLMRANRVPTVSRNRMNRLSTDDEGRIELRGCLPGHPYDLWIVGQERSWKRIAPEEMRSEEPLEIVLDDRLRVTVEDAAGERFEIVEATHQGFSERDRADKWNAIPIVDRGTAASFFVLKESYQFHGPRSEIAMWCRTEDDVVVFAKGHFPARGSHIRLAADKVVRPQAEITIPSDIEIGENDLVFRVTTPEGKPLAGVRIVSDPLAGYRSHKLDGETDHRGWCVFKGVKEQVIYFEFTKDGHAPQWHANLKKGSAIPVMLSNSTRFEGQILGQDGASPGIVSLRLEASREKQWPDGRVGMVDTIPLILETDNEGRYDFLIEPGHYNLYAESQTAGFLSLEQLEVKAEQVNTLPPRLQPGVTTELRLTDSITGEPLAGVPVIVREQTVPYQIGIREGSRRVSDAAGIVRWENLRLGHVRFDCPQMAPWSREEQIPYSRWWSKAHAYEFGREAARRFESEAPRGGDGVGDLVFELKRSGNRFDVTMERGTLISGVVELPETQPVGAIMVTLVPARGERTSLTWDSRDDIPVDKENGTFSAWMPAGNGLKYRACAFLRDDSDPTTKEYLPATVSEPFDSKPGDAFTFNLSMLEGGWVHGRVVDGAGRPKPGVGIQALPTDHLTGVDAEPTAVTDADGQYRMGPIRATEYEIRIDETPGVNIDANPKDKRYVTVPMDGSVEVADLIYP